MLIAKEVPLAFTNLRESRRVRTVWVTTAAWNVWGDAHVSRSKFLEPVNRMWICLPGLRYVWTKMLLFDYNYHGVLLPRGARGCFTNSQAKGLASPHIPVLHTLQWDPRDSSSANGTKHLLTVEERSGHCLCHTFIILPLCSCFPPIKS